MKKKSKFKYADMVCIRYCNIKVHKLLIFGDQKLAF